VILLLLPVSIDIQAQTEVSGGIYNDVVWNRDQSPYLITGDIVVFPGKTLKVEPGVHIRFMGDYYLEVRGTINMEGRMGDTILVNSIVPPSKSNAWNSIVMDDTKAEFSFSYCKFDSLKYGIYAVQHKQVHSNTRISNCSFSHCIGGINDRTMHYPIRLDTCSFTNNSIGINSDSLIITHSKFIHNDIAMVAPGGVDISDSEFHGNGTAILMGQYGTIENCSFTENDLAISTWEGGFKLRNNIIMYNRIGLSLTSLWGSALSHVENNRICNNSLYNVEYLDKPNISIGGNCWCTTDSAEIEEKIYDGYDDITKGLLDYDIYDTLCENKIKSVEKGVSTTTEGSRTDQTEGPALEFFPNPVTDQVRIRIKSLLEGSNRIQIYRTDGSLVIEREIHQYTVSIDLSRLEKGVYLIKCSNLNFVKPQLLIKL
jgi:hypothetical protein